MATSSDMSTSNQYIKYNITVTENSQSIENNTSNVTVSVRFRRTNTGYTTYGHGTMYCKINGVTYSASVDQSQKITSSGIVLFTKTLDIPHATDGSKTLTTSAWINISVLTSTEQSYSQVLTTIPRASTFGTITGDTLGSVITVNITRASTNFTHQVWYKVGDASWADLGTGIGTSTSFTPALSLAAQFPSATSGNMQLCVRTYSGSTRIGSDVYKDVTVKVPSSVKPTISSVSITEATAGLAAKFGAYVQNKSTLEVAITAAGLYGSTITRYSTDILTTAYTGSSFTSGVIKTSGTVYITTTVTDSRGRTASHQESITVLTYAPPSIESLSAWRIDTSGTAADDGTRLAVKAKYAIASVGGLNDRTYKIQYKKTSSSSWSSVATGTAEWTYDGTQTFLSSPALSTDYAYQIRLQITDYFGTVTASVDISTAFTLMDFRSTGKGVAIGKVSEADELEVAIPAVFSSTVKVGDGELSLNRNLTLTDASTLPNKPTGSGAYGRVLMISYSGEGSYYLYIDTSNGNLYTGKMGTSETEITWYDKN